LEFKVGWTKIYFNPKKKKRVQGLSLREKHPEGWPVAAADFSIEA